MSRSTIYKAGNLLPAFLGLILTSAFCHAQANTFYGSAPDTTGLASALALYERTLATSLPIYRGSIYTDYHRGVRGHPFWLSDSWEYGKLLYDGQWYPNVYLRYDVTRDIVLLQGYDERGYLVSLQINQLKTQAFEITDQTFVHEQSGVVAEKLGKGFYELHYDGSVRVLVKCKKSLQQTKSLNSIYLEFQEKTRLFIQMGGNVYPIKRRSHILALLDDDGRNLRNHLRAMGLKSGSDILGTACEAAAFHDRYLSSDD